MTRKPKMILEVLEAIAEYFKDNPEIATDCYLYLASSLSDAREQDRARTAKPLEGHESARMKSFSQRYLPMVRLRWNC